MATDVHSALIQFVDEQEAAFTIAKDEAGDWATALIWDREAEDSPMAGGAAYGVGSSADEAIRAVLLEAGVAVRSLTDADFEALAKEAEVGYDVSSGEPRRPRVIDVRGTYVIPGRGTMTNAVEPDPPFRMDELVTVAGTPFYVKAIERHPVSGGPRPGLNVGLLLQAPDEGGPSASA